MLRHSRLALLAGAASSALFAPIGATPGSEECVADTCAAYKADDHGDDHAAHMQLRTGQRNASVVDTDANGVSALGTTAPVTTSMAERLMQKLETTGLLVRAPDGGVASGSKPATFWRSDIHVPNQFFLLSGNKGFLHTRAVLGYVVEPDGPLKWKPETLYAHDANACDSPSKLVSFMTPDTTAGRCTYMADGYYYDCPGAVAGDCGLGPIQLAARAGLKPLADAFEAACGLVGDPKVVLPDPKMQGAGNHKCRGCHFIQGLPGFKFLMPGFFDGKDLTLPWDTEINQGRNCQCNCKTTAGCTALAGTLVKKHAFSTEWTIDKGICWTDSTDMLVAMQNALWDTRKKINPLDASNFMYWGWNEVAVPQHIDEPQYYAANMIFMTPQMSNGKSGPQGLEALSQSLQRDLEGQIKDAAHGKKPTIKVGSAARGQHPGSDVILVRQNLNGGKFSFEFFCQDYTPSNGAEYKICAKAKTAADPGHCYLEYVKVACL